MWSCLLQSSELSQKSAELVRVQRDMDGQVNKVKVRSSSAGFAPLPLSVIHPTIAMPPTHPSTSTSTQLSPPPPALAHPRRLHSRAHAHQPLPVCSPTLGCLEGQGRGPGQGGRGGAASEPAAGEVGRPVCSQQVGPIGLAG